MRYAVLIVLAACGDNISAAGFPFEQRDATCGYYVRCGAIATFSECRQIFNSVMASNPSLEAALDAGKIRYSGAAAADCIHAIDQLDCDLTRQPADALAACDDVYIGTGRNGAACAFDGECASERCVVPDCNDACCQGTCEAANPLPGPGEPCSVVCADGHFCGVDSICHPDLGEGQSCNSLTVCAYPLYCNTACTRPAQTGEPCVGYCALEGDVCGPDARCVPAAVSGDDCMTAYQCSPYYFCDFNVGECRLPAQEGRAPNGSICTFNSQCTSRYCDSVCADPPICF